jgi:hypothetical protein
MQSVKTQSVVVAAVVTGTVICDVGISCGTDTPLSELVQKQAYRQQVWLLTVSPGKQSRRGHQQFSCSLFATDK